MQGWTPFKPEKSEEPAAPRRVPHIWKNPAKTQYRILRGAAQW